MNIRELQDRVHVLEQHRDVWRRRCAQLEDAIREGRIDDAREKVAEWDREAKEAF